MGSMVTQLTFPRTQKTLQKSIFNKNILFSCVGSLFIVMSLSCYTTTPSHGFSFSRTSDQLIPTPHLFIHLCSIISLWYSGESGIWYLERELKCLKCCIISSQLHRFFCPGEFSHKEPGLSFPSSPHQFMNVTCTNSSEQRAPAQFSIRGSPQLTLAKEQPQCSWYGSQGAKMESQNHLGWKSPLRWPSPTTNSPLPRPPVAHGSTSMRILNPSGNCDTTTGLGSMFKHLATLSGEEMCLKMQSNPPLEQSDTIISCPISCHSCMARYKPPSTCLDDFTELLSGTPLPSYLHICAWTIGPSSCGGCLNNDFSKTAL